MGEMELSFDRLNNITKLDLNQVVDSWETGMWRDDLDCKRRCGYKAVINGFTAITS